MKVLANAGVDVFEEVFKLIFIKLWDEFKSQKDKYVLDSIIHTQLSKQDYSDYEKLKEFLKTDSTISKIINNFRVMEFRNTGQSEGELKKKIQKLFDEAKTKWPGIRVRLTYLHLIFQYVSQVFKM